MTKSLTTAAAFLPMIEHLPLNVIEQHPTHLVLVPATEVEVSHLYHALTIAAGKRGLTVRKGVAVWTVRGFAQ